MGTLIGIGRTAEVFEYGDGKVLKLFYAGFPDTAVETELGIAMILNQEPNLAPHCEGSVDRDGRRGIVYTRAPGVQLAAHIVAKPLALVAHARRLAAVQLIIFKTAGLPLPPVQQNLGWGLDSTRHLSRDECRAMKLLLDVLPRGEAVLHGDFHPQNLLVEGERHAIIDWTNAARGDPLADVARTWVILRFGRAPEGSLTPIMMKVSRAYMRLLAIVYEREMRKNLGFTRGALQQWKVVVAAARLAELGDDAEMRETRSWLRRRMGHSKVN